MLLSSKKVVEANDVFAVAKLREDGDLVFEGEGVFAGEFGAGDAFDGVGCCGGAGVCAPFYYGEGSAAERLGKRIKLIKTKSRGRIRSWCRSHGC